MARSFNIGDKVRISPSSGDGTCNSIRKFKGKVGVIEKVHRNSLGVYYTLCGFDTKAGLPYFFCGEWLLPVEEGSDA